MSKQEITIVKDGDVSAEMGLAYHNTLDSVIGSGSVTEVSSTCLEAIRDQYPSISRFNEVLPIVTAHEIAHGAAGRYAHNSHPANNEGGIMEVDENFSTFSSKTIRRLRTTSKAWEE